MAPLGLTFTQGTAVPAQFASGVFIGEHGSWNRDPPVGYKVVYVPFQNGRPNGTPQDVVTGFISDDAKTRGRPVGVAIDRTGALLVADDVGNAVWRVTASTGPAGAPSTR
jgi:glucose/arabinose dehydrogenase